MAALEMKFSFPLLLPMLVCLVTFLDEFCQVWILYRMWP